LAKADWSREPQPPATFTLELNEDEAMYVAAMLGHGDQYHILNATGEKPIYTTLLDALHAAGLDPRLYRALTKKVSKYLGR